MNDVLLIFLSLSVSGSILALILLSIKPLIKNRLSQSWQYYIWLIVILRFLLPFTPQVSVVGELSRNIQNISNPPAVVEVDPGIGANEEYTIPQAPDVPQISQAPATQNTESETPVQPTYWQDILSNIWLLWIGVALVLFVHKVANYRSFARFIKVGMKTLTDTHIWDIYQSELAAAKIKRQLPLYENSQAVSPMLVGIVRPALVIPALEASDDELRNILRHELTHYKRLDFLYKWIVQITMCLHWFNPLVYLINKQISKSCELSCDESVIKHLDENDRITYGDALIASLKKQGNYSDFVVSMTMSENGNIVKERLDMIMSYKKKSKLIFCISTLLTILLLCGFTFAGAYAAIGNSAPTEPGSYWNNLFNLPHKQELGQVLTTSNLQFGNYELKADSNYTLTISWQDGGNTIKIYLIGQNAYQNEYTLTNGVSANITVPEDGLYYFKSPWGRETGVIKKLLYSFQENNISAGVEQPSSVLNTNTAKNNLSSVTINYCKIKYEDTIYAWPYVTHTITNNFNKTITDYQIGLLAYDRDGNPMELYWDARNVDKGGDHGNVGFGNGVDYGIVVGIYPYSPKSYDWLIDDVDNISPGKTQIEVEGGWPLFDGWWDQPNGVHQVSYILSCIKQVEFEDGTTWENPEYSHWLETYKGKTVDLQILQSYYPYK